MHHFKENKMNKLEMAHDYLLKLMETNPKLNAKYATEFVWEMVDAMQAEADKRVNMERPDVLKASNSMELEWQPDWSQAPD